MREMIQRSAPKDILLGTLLFLIYIYNLDEEIKNKISRFTNTTKLATSVRNFEGYIII